MNEQYADFRDPTELTRWTRVSLYAILALSLIDVWIGNSGLRGDGGEGSPTWMMIAVLRVLATIAIGLATAILVLNWIQRANHNARHLGAADMKYTPGWAVGWYFVPVAWFWKPYQAMKETWRASANPADWRREPVSPLLHWWWALWILPFWGVSPVDWAVGRTLDEAGVETLEAATSLVGGLLDIPLVLVLLAIIGAVNRMQLAHHRRQAAAG